jgi:hypothetical protein
MVIASAEAKYTSAISIMHLFTWRSMSWQDEGTEGRTFIGDKYSPSHNLSLSPRAWSP